MKLSASIMAHPDRRDLVEELLTDLNADEDQVPIAWDDEGPPSARPDRGWRTARRAWQLHDPAADWHLLLQDDAAVCSDLREGLLYALEHVPEPSVVSLYLGKGPSVAARWGRMAVRADELGASWVRSFSLKWGVAIAAPVAMIPDMLTWCDRKAGVPDDLRVSRFFQRQNVDAWYTWPSLVDHRQVPSLSGHRHPRSAHRHHQGSALQLAWDGPVVLDPMISRSRFRSAPSAERRSARA